MTVRRVLQHIAPFTPYTTAAEALACFAADPALNAAPVVDQDGVPLGLVVRATLRMKLADKAGAEMFANAPITQVMDAAPLIIEDDMSLATLCDVVLRMRPQAFHDGFIITQGDRYVGLGAGIAVLDAVAATNMEVTERLRLAMNAGRSAVWEIDFTRKKLIGAESLDRIFKRTLTFDAVRTLSAEFVIPEERENVRKALVEIAAGNGRGKLRARVRDAHGRERELSHSIEVFKDADDKVARIILLTIDATIARRIGLQFDQVVDKMESVLSERREMIDRITEKLGMPALPVRDEEAAPNYGATYENVGRNRGRMLKMIDDVIVRDQALIAAVEVAEAASEAKSRFLASMSHELRTPLNAILGYAEILDEDLTEADMGGPASDARRIRSSAGHLLHLINEILDLSKIEAGRMDVLPEPFDVTSLVRDVVDTVRPLADKNANLLSVTVSADLGQACTDNVKVNQCLMNLLSNACKFTSGGEVRLTGKRERINNRECLVFEIRDSGIGMTDVQIAKLFQPFMQADATTTRNFGGTGLGLAITQRLARLLGGDVAVTSVLGEGAVFTLHVPVRFGATDAGTSGADNEAPLEMTTNRPVVLIIDDDFVSRDLVRRALSRLGFAIAEAATGQEGLQAALTHRPALIVLDIQLPDVSGWNVLERLQQEAAYGAPPVMIHSIEDDRARSVALGACDHIVKPANRDILAAAVVRYARFTGAQAAPAQPMQNVA